MRSCGITIGILVYCIAQDVFEFDVVSSRNSHFCVVFPFHPDREGLGGQVRRTENVLVVLTP